MLHPIDKGSVVDVSVVPDKDAIEVFGFVVEELADVDVSIDVLQSIAVLAVVLEVSFVEPEEVGLVDEKAVPMVEVIAVLSQVDAGRTLEEHDSSMFLNMLTCYLLQLFIRVFKESIRCFLFLSEEIFNEDFLLMKHFLVNFDVGRKLLFLKT